MHRLRAAAGARQDAVDRDERADRLEAGLLGDLAARNRLRRLALVDDPGDDLELPGRPAGEIGRQTKLLDQDDLVFRLVPEEDSRGAAALEHLALEFLGPASIMSAVPKPVFVDAEEAGVPGL